MITGLHHVSITVADMERARAFYEGVLGLRPCPQKMNWLATGDGYSLHLMPARTDLPHDPARHLALQVERLEAVVARLLQHGLHPYQLSVTQSGRHLIETADDTLAFGIGTVFIEDPDGNSVEFVQEGRGILGAVANAIADAAA